MRKRNTKDDCKVQTLALEIIKPLNECAGRLSRVSTRHKHNRRGMQKKVREKSKSPWYFLPNFSWPSILKEVQNKFSRWLPFWISSWNDFRYFLTTGCPDTSYQVLSQLAFRLRRRRANSGQLGFPSRTILAIFDLHFLDTFYQVSNQLAQGLRRRRAK